MPSSLNGRKTAASSPLPILGRAILASRYLLMVFFFGLAAGLALYAVRFVAKLWELAVKLLSSTEEDVLIAVLLGTLAAAAAPPAAIEKALAATSGPR